MPRQHGLVFERRLKFRIGLLTLNGDAEKSSETCEEMAVRAIELTGIDNYQTESEAEELLHRPSRLAARWENFSAVAEHLFLQNVPGEKISEFA